MPVTFDDDEIKEIMHCLDAAELPLYAHLDQQFGSYKKAPDDHWIFNALNRIKDAKDYFPSVEEDETE